MWEFELLAKCMTILIKKLMGSNSLLKCIHYAQDTWEDGGEIGGSGGHFTSAPVKRLADLRSRANSQWYSSIYEDWTPKIEDIERSDGKKSA